MTAREITDPVDLTQPSGQVNPDAIGWTRHPLHRGVLPGWGRRKRWEYWGIVTPSHIIGVTVSSLDYAALHAIYILDRAQGTETTREAVVPLARGVLLPEHSGTGRVLGAGRGLRVELDQDRDGVRLHVRAEGIELEATMPAVEGRESLGVVVPWGARRFQYTHKDVGRPVHGSLVLDEQRHVIDRADSFAVLDHGRGKWPYSVTWNWAAGAEPGARGRAIQLGGKWTDGTGQTENAVFVDGRLHKLHDDLRWDYDRSDWLAPWRMSGPGVSVGFAPFHERRARTQLGIVASQTHQCFGTFSGHVRTEDGERVDLGGVVGWAEEARQRW